MIYKEFNIDVVYEGRHNITIRPKIEIFESSWELSKVTGERKELAIFNEHGDGRRFVYLRKEWHGINSNQEGKDLMEHGWKPSLNGQKKLLEKKKMNMEEKKFKIKPAIVGFAPIVPNCIMGLPKQMMDMEKGKKKRKVMTIVYSPNLNNRRFASDFETAGKATAETVLELEQEGYRINLYTLMSFVGPEYHDKAPDIVAVKVKDASQPMCMARHMFATGHPAMMRWAMFMWYERFPKSIWREAYGRVLESRYGRDGEEKVIKKIFENEEVTVLTARGILERGNSYIKEQISKTKEKTKWER